MFDSKCIYDGVNFSLALNLEACKLEGYYLIWLDKVYRAIDMVLFILSNTSSIDDDTVNDILKQLEIDSPSIPAEEKIKVLCTVFRTSVGDNVQ